MLTREKESGISGPLGIALGRDARGEEGSWVGEHPPFLFHPPPRASLFACRPRHSSAPGALQVLVGAGWTWGSSADRKSSEFSGRQWESPWRCGSGEEQDQVGVVEREPWHQQKIRYWRRSRDKLVRSWLKYIVEVRASQRGWWGGKQEGREEEDMVMERRGMTTGWREAEWWEALEYHWGQEESENSVLRLPPGAMLKADGSTGWAQGRFRG